MRGSIRKTILFGLKLVAMMVLSLVCFNLNCFAVSGTIVLKTDKNDLKAGEDIVVAADLSSESKLYAMTATLQYDQNIFEPINDDNFKVADSEEVSYNSENNKFGIINKKGEIDNNLFEIHLRVKNDAVAGDTNIALTNIESSDGSNKTEYTMASTQVMITKDMAEGEAVPANPENTIAEGEKETKNVFFTWPFVLVALIMVGVIILVGILNFSNLTPRISKLYYGLIVLGVVISVLIVVITVNNNSKKDVNGDGKLGYDDAKEVIDYLIELKGTKDEDTSKNDKNNKQDSNGRGDGSKGGYSTNGATGNLASTNGVTTGSATQTTGSVSAGSTDRHYDTNDDGKVDVGDAGHVTEQTTKETTIKISDAKDQSEYVSKGFKTFVFDAKIEPEGVKLKSVKLKIGEDGEEKEYLVTFRDGVYEVEFDPLDEPGKKTIIITKATADNNKEVNVNYKRNIEILKSRPDIKNFRYGQGSNKVTFELYDIDDAFIEGEARIFKKEDMAGGPVVKGPIKKDELNELIYESGFEDDTTYYIELAGKYCLTSDKNNEQHCYDAVFTDQEFTIQENYNFVLDEFSVTDYVEPTSRPRLNFHSANARNLTVTKAKVSVDNGEIKEYPVKRNGDGSYEVVIEQADMKGGSRHSVQLESVELENGRTFRNPAHFEVPNNLTYYVPDSVPTVKDLHLTPDKQNSKVNARFNLQDESKTVQRITVIMTDSNERVVDKKVIDKNDPEFAQLSSKGIDLSYSNDQSTVQQRGFSVGDTSFTVTVLADYDLGENHNFQDQEMATDSLAVIDENKLYIEDIKSRNLEMDKSPQTRYTEKNQKRFQLMLKLYRDKDLKLVGTRCTTNYTTSTSYTVNGGNYAIYGLEDAWNKQGYHAVSIGTPDRAGVLDLEVSRIQYVTNGYGCQASDWFSLAPKGSYKIEVLKDKPQIENLKIDEDYEAQTVTLEFDVKLDETATDEDESLKEGKIKFGDLPEATYGRRHNKVTFENVPKDEVKNLTFKASYDRDTDTLSKELGLTDENEVTDGVIFETQYGLIDPAKYDEVKIDKASALTNNKEENDAYFEKYQEIGLYFDIQNLPEQTTPMKVKLEGRSEEFELVQIVDDEGQIVPNSYAIFIPGYGDAGEWSVRISEVILDNGKHIELKDKEKSPEIEFEVLKDTPTITDFKYDSKGGKFNITSKLNDPDKAIVGDAEIKIVNDMDEDITSQILDEDHKYKENFSFEFDAETQYYLTVTADYDRTHEQINNAEHYNYHEDAVLLDTSLSSDNKYIELKEIKDVNLYHVVNGETKLVNETSVDEIEDDLDNYFVEIIMEKMPTVRAKVHGAMEMNDHLNLTVEGDYLTIDDTNEQSESGEAPTYEANLDFGEINEQGKAVNEFHPEIAFQKMIDKLKNVKEGETIELDRDYDASKVKSEDAKGYISEFKGKLNGNEHTIRNLSAPLFDVINAGEISNLSLVGVTVDSNGHGALANTAKSAKITNVFVSDVTNTGGVTSTNAGLIGSIDSTEIKASKVSNVMISGLKWLEQQNGLFVANAQKSNITDCYAEGTIIGGWNYSSGFVGKSDNTTAINNYVNLSYKNHDTGGAKAFVWGGGGSTYKNNIVIASGTDGSFAGGAQLENNYLYVTSGTAKQADGVNIISADDVNADLFKNRAGFDAETWRIESNTSVENLPKLKAEKQTDAALESKKDFIPGNEKVYNNVEKLMPYYEYSEILKAGNKIAKGGVDANMTDKSIKMVLPLDADGNVVTYVTTKDQDKIKSLKVVYDDESAVKYSVSYTKTYDMVASYRIRKLHMDYNFPQYVVNADSRTVDNLTYYLKDLDYLSNLDTLSKEEDGRVMRDFYNETTSKEIKEFVMKYLANSDYINTTSEDSTINNRLEWTLKSDQRLVKALYVYNYLRRFYDLDINGVKMYDMMMFEMRNLDESLTTDKIVDLFFQNAANFRTNETNSQGYNNVYKRYTNKEDLSDFLAYMVKILGDGMKPEEWTRKQFKGRLEEISIDGQPDIAYTLWDHLSMSDKYYGKQMLNFILPILTLPKDASYIFSMPTHIIIGSQRTYLADPTNPDSVKAFDIRVDAYAARYKTYFQTAYGILQDKSLFNNMHLYQVDKISAYDDNGVSSRQRPGSTNDPHFKNFNEVIKRFPADGGINAGSYGNRIEWDVAGVMDSNLKEIVDKTKEEVPSLKLDWSEATFGTFSHETLHNIDAKVFLRDNGRRWDSGGEDYADGNLRQEFSSTLIVMNLSKDWGKDCEYSANCSPERVDTQQEVQSFYSKAFDVIYTMDYIESLAFLQLEPEDMAEIAVQASYPNEKGESFTGQLQSNFPEGLLKDEKSRYRAYHTTKYTKKDAEFYRELKNQGKLNTVEDLYDNRIVIYPGVWKETSYGDNKYGSEGLGNVHWYQPHNNYGRPDSYSLKWMAYEMMGLKGWDDGYVEYYSNKIGREQKVPYTYYTSFNDGQKQPFTNESLEELPQVQRLPTTSAPNPNNGNYYMTDEMAFKEIIDDYDSYDHNKYEDGFEKYKKDRFKKIEENLQYLNKEIDIEKYVNMFYTAMLKDVKYQKDGIASKLATKGGDEQKCMEDYWCMNGFAAYGMIGLNQYLTKRFSTAARVDFYQKLKRMTNDFRDEDVIYKKEKQQNVDLDYLRKMMKDRVWPEDVTIVSSPYVADTTPGAMIGPDGKLQFDGEDSLQQVDLEMTNEMVTAVPEGQDD